MQARFRESWKQVSFEGSTMSQTHPVTDLKDEKEQLQLMSASLAGEIETVEALLRKGADVNARNSKGRTALMFAVINRHAATVQLLLDFAADVNAQAEDGFTPLILGACSGDLGITQMLLNNGADVRKTAKSGDTAISHATEHGYSDIVELLKRAMGQSTNRKSKKLPSDLGKRKETALVPQQITIS